MDKAALFLVIVGALNWLLVGLFQFDLVAALFGGQDSALSRIVYSLVGFAGLWCTRLLASRPSYELMAHPAAKFMENEDADKEKK